MRRYPSLLLLTAVVLALVTPAWAHDKQSSLIAVVAPAIESAQVGVAPAASSSRAAPIGRASTQSMLLGLVVLLGVAMVVGAARCRRCSLVTLPLLVILMVFIFESGVHSVHHLRSPHNADQCGLASASTHVDGAAVAAVRLDVSTFSGALAERRLSWIVPPRPLLPDQQRAPPFAG